jgi:hypothetical protein
MKLLAEIQIRKDNEAEHMKTDLNRQLKEVKKEYEEFVKKHEETMSKLETERQEENEACIKEVEGKDKAIKDLET